MSIGKQECCGYESMAILTQQVSIKAISGGSDITATCPFPLFPGAWMPSCHKGQLTAGHCPGRFGYPLPSITLFLHAPQSLPIDSSVVVQHRTSLGNYCPSGPGSFFSISVSHPERCFSRFSLTGTTLASRFLCLSLVSKLPPTLDICLTNL